MTSVVIAPRVEDLTSDTEAVASGGWFRIRPARAYKAGGQWVHPVWPANVTNLNGAAVTVKLDPVADVPYELELAIPDGNGGLYHPPNEFRYVTASASPLNWEDLVQEGGPGASAPLPSNAEARLLALETLYSTLSGGASTLAGITDMTATARSFNAQSTTASMRNNIGAANATHTHGVTDLTATGSAGAGNKYLADDNTWKTPTGVVAGSVAWADITSKPTTFAPSTHGHAITDVTGLQAALDAGTTATTAAQATADAAVDTADIGSILSDALAPYVTTTQLTAALANVPYLLSYNGTAWPVARPAGAGTRTVMALGAPVAPTWLDTARDFWVGTVA